MFWVEPIAFVRASRQVPDDDFWGGTRARLELAPDLSADSLLGLDAFSHVEILFVFDRVTPDQIVRDARHPRGNLAWPRTGIFAQRGKHRPNRLGVSVARVLGVEDRVLTVGELDAIDGTPVLDIKPVMRELQARGEIRQPAWASELMRDYWATPAPR